MTLVLQTNTKNPPNTICMNILTINFRTQVLAAYITPSEIFVFARWLS